MQLFKLFLFNATQNNNNEIIINNYTTLTYKNCLLEGCMGRHWDIQDNGFKYPWQSIFNKEIL